MTIEVRRVGGLDDLHRWVEARNAASSDALTTEMRVLVRALELDYVDLIALDRGRPVGTAFLSGDPWSAGGRSWFEVRVPREERGRGVGAALFDAVAEHARRAAAERLRCSARGDDREALAFLGRRGFSVVDRHEQVSRELAGPVPPVPAPAGVSVDWLVDDPGLLSGMFELARASPAVQGGRPAVRDLSEAQWRTYELGSPLVRLDLTAVARMGRDVAGYSVVQDFPGHRALFHRAVVPPEASEVARALLGAQAGRAVQSGVDVLLAVPRHPRLATLFAGLGYEPRKEWLELEGPVA